jgi:hypothetical protein
MAQKAYEAEQAAGSGGGGGAAEEPRREGATADNVVDADFEEVRDDK